MKIHICELAPTLLSQEMQAKIGDFNEHLKTWSESNGIHYVKTDPSFRLGSGEVDDMCYDMESESPGSTLNRLGIIRLLCTINKHIRICKNIDTIKWSTQTYLKTQNNNTNQQNRKYPVTFPSTRNNSPNQSNNDNANTIRTSDRIDVTDNQPPNTWAEVVRRNSTVGHTLSSPGTR